MDHAKASIRIVPEVACGACDGDTRPPSCHGDFGRLCATPDLRGPAELLRLALDSLRTVVDRERGLNLVDGQLVAALRVDAGEAELTVTFPHACGNARLMAEDAFQSLRRVLPDTDIYVRHAA